MTSDVRPASGTATKPPAGPHGLVNVGGHGWWAVSTVLPLALAVVILAAFSVIERHTKLRGDRSRRGSRRPPQASR
jgi:heme exporter protein D